MKKIINTIKLTYWRRKLKSAYLDYIQNDYDCGSTMANYLTGDRERVNHCIDMINKLDAEAKLNHL